MQEIFVVIFLYYTTYKIINILESQGEYAHCFLLFVGFCVDSVGFFILFYLFYAEIYSLCVRFYMTHAG